MIAMLYFTLATGRSIWMGFTEVVKREKKNEKLSSVYPNSVNTFAWNIYLISACYYTQRGFFWIKIIFMTLVYFPRLVDCR